MVAPALSVLLSILRRRLLLLVTRSAMLRHLGAGTTLTPFSILVRIPLPLLPTILLLLPTILLLLPTILLLLLTRRTLGAKSLTLAGLEVAPAAAPAAAPA